MVVTESNKKLQENIKIQIKVVTCMNNKKVMIHDSIVCPAGCTFLKGNNEN